MNASKPQVTTVRVMWPLGKLEAKVEPWSSSEVRLGPTGCVGRRAGDRDERQRQGSDRQQVISESYRWHVRQKTVIRPPRRMAASGLPHLKQGSPPRP